MDRPIIFSAPMVRALLAGRKTQTRRILTKLMRFGAVTEFGPSDTRGYDWHFRDRRMLWNDLRDAELKASLPYAVGDRLWVRENCQAHEQASGEDGVHFPADEAWLPIQAGSRGAADDWVTLNHYGKRRGAVVPSIHMPRWASRLTLLVTDVRVERLNAITNEDAAAEGLLAERTPAAGILRNVATDECAPLVRTQWQGAPDLPLRGMERAAFRDLWNSINGADAWDANPWVVAVSFQSFQTNIDRMPERQAASVPAATE